MNVKDVTITMSRVWGGDFRQVVEEERPVVLLIVRENGVMTCCQNITEGIFTNLIPGSA